MTYQQEDKELLKYFIAHHVEFQLIMNDRNEREYLDIMLEYLNWADKFQIITNLALLNLPGDPRYNILRTAPNNYKSITIRLSDLKLFVNSELQDDLFCGGQYVLRNNKIVDIIPYNVSGFITLVDVRHNFLPKCFLCNIKENCQGFNFKSSFDAFGEPLIPEKDFCKRMKAQYGTTN